MNQATISITRDSHGKLESVSVVMPSWEKEGDDGAIVINMPFFGIRLFAFDGMDIDELSHDAIKSFCLNCERFGLKLETELLTMGWVNVTEDTMVYSIDSGNFVINEILHTGEQLPQFVDFKNELELAHA